MNYKKIHIGKLIDLKVMEAGLKTGHICRFFKCDMNEINKMYEAETLDAEILLSWCKLLKYDFFRVYTQHLILYSPKAKARLSSEDDEVKKPARTELHKNLYTVEIIAFIMEKISSGEMTKLQIINRYGIPKTTLYKWISKYESTEA
ncbi:transposase [Chryseobacterium sp. 22532]|uniref:transposase n=1 Tax=Chryseobacterium sp. 22532 TaxID=3453938 RepID=UPI003F83ED46